ncbi:MAG: hypothetical protein M3304_04230, partial [Actinomycetota bacterium]|nr:hypothetical protein [Actinomycetota bacterium]
LQGLGALFDRPFPVDQLGVATLVPLAGGGQFAFGLSERLRSTRALGVRVSTSLVASFELGDERPRPRSNPLEDVRVLPEGLAQLLGERALVSLQFPYAPSGLFVLVDGGVEIGVEIRAALIDLVVAILPVAEVGRDGITLPPHSPPVDRSGRLA